MVVSLVASFVGGYRGAAPAQLGEPFEAALRDVFDRGSAAWPDVALEARVFVAYLSERVPPDVAPVEWLRDARAGDLFLACACAEGSPVGLRAFGGAFLDKLPLYLRALRPTPQLVDETKQDLLASLFVGERGKAPKILQYRGQGALESWVRVVALRTALNRLNAERVGDLPIDEADEVAHAIASSADPELELAMERYKGDFIAAFREAMSSLPPRDRSVLRFTYVDGLTPARIGIVYGVHRTTAMRWIEAAEEAVLVATRTRLIERLRLSQSECDGLIALMKSRIHVTLTSLLKEE